MHSRTQYLIMSIGLKYISTLKHKVSPANWHIFAPLQGYSMFYQTDSFCWIQAPVGHLVVYPLLHFLCCKNIPIVLNNIMRILGILCTSGSFHGQGTTVKPYLERTFIFSKNNSLFFQQGRDIQCKQPAIRLLTWMPQQMKPYQVLSIHVWASILERSNIQQWI